MFNIQQTSDLTIAFNVGRQPDVSKVTCLEKGNIMICMQRHRTRLVGFPGSAGRSQFHNLKVFLIILFGRVSGKAGLKEVGQNTWINPF